MIECRNWTHASDYWDIFTLARDRGAVAAVSRGSQTLSVHRRGCRLTLTCGLVRFGLGWHGTVVVHDGGAELPDQPAVPGRFRKAIERVCDEIEGFGDVSVLIPSTTDRGAEVADRNRGSGGTFSLIEAQFNATQPQFWHYNESLLNQS